MRAEEIIEGDKEGGKGNGTILGREASGGSDVELVGAIEAFDKLFKRPESGGNRVQVLKADNIF